MPNEIISYKTDTVTFYNDSITAVKDQDGEIWALINDILRNIGFDEKKIDNQRTAWLKDIVVSRGTKILDLQINGYKRQANCLNRRYIPLALAKISITPTMQREQPEIVNKLIRYQEECADVLYKYFYKSKTMLSNEIPLTREEMAMYWTNMMAMFRDYTQILERREKARDDVLDKVISNQAELYKTLSLSQKLYQDAAVKLFDTVKETKDKSYSSVSPKEIVEKPFATPKLTNNSWINAANDSVLSIAKESHKDIPAQYREVYSLMRKNGYAINKVAGVKLIDTISKNKKLRDGFNSVISDLHKKYKVKNINSGNNQQHIYKSVLIRQVPEEIMTDIKVYAKKKNISYKVACGRIYKRIEELGKLSLDSMMREYSHKIGFTACNKYYMILNNKYLMDLFNKVIQEA